LLRTIVIAQEQRLRFTVRVMILWFRLATWASGETKRTRQRLVAVAGPLAAA